MNLLRIMPSRWSSVNRGGWRCHVSWRYHKSELKVAAGHKNLDSRVRISQNESSLQVVHPYHWLGPKVMTTFQMLLVENFLLYFVLHCYFIRSLWPKLIDDWLFIQYILQDLRCFISIIIVSIQKYWYDPSKRHYIFCICGMDAVNLIYGVVRSGLRECWIE